MRQLVAGGHIGCCIAYTEVGAVILVRNVGLCVADSSLDKCSSSSLVVGADVLVTSEEANDVLVLLQRIDDACVSLIQRDIPFWIIGFDRCAGLAQVGNHVDIRSRELGHAIIMVLGRVDGVHANDVCEYLLKVRNVALAGVTIR